MCVFVCHLGLIDDKILQSILFLTRNQRSFVNMCLCMKLHICSCEKRIEFIVFTLLVNVKLNNKKKKKNVKC